MPGIQRLANRHCDTTCPGGKKKRRWNRKGTPARPGIVSARDADGDNGCLRPLDEELNARFERLHLAVVSTIPFGKNHHGPALLELFQDRFNSFLTNSLLVNRHRVEHPDK